MAINFAQLFKKSNSSLNQLEGNVLQCSLSDVRGDRVVIETGLARSSVCFQNELNTISNQPQVAQQKEGCLIGIQKVESPYGEPVLVFPKSLHKISRRKLIWTKLTQIWRSAQNNRIKGFILNSVKGGYAVALAGNIAFLPWSLRLDRKVFHGQWRMFSILNMNPKIGNIVVKEYSPRAVKGAAVRRLNFRPIKRTGRFSARPKHSRHIAVNRKKRSRSGPQQHPYFKLHTKQAAKQHT